jgi:hypothetical protein
MTTAVFSSSLPDERIILALLAMSLWLRFQKETVDVDSEEVGG